MFLRYQGYDRPFASWVRGGQKEGVKSVRNRAAKWMIRR